jgi:hypothetical protein
MKIIFYNCIGENTFSDISLDFFQLKVKDNLNSVSQRTAATAVKQQMIMLVPHTEEPKKMCIHNVPPSFYLTVQ